MIFCVLSLGLVFFLGQDFFPQVDAGLIRLHFRALPGLRVEETARLCDEVEQVLRSEIPAEELQTMLDNIGVPYSGINLSYCSSGVIGTNDAEILISLNPEHHHPTAQYIRRLRRELPTRFPGVEFFFQPADIVSQILNFGLPAPVDIQIMGADMRTNYDIGQKIANRLRQIPGSGRRARATNAEPAHSSSGHGPHAHQSGRTECPRCSAECADQLEWEFPDHAQFLAESKKRCHLSRSPFSRRSIR